MTLGIMRDPMKNSHYPLKARVKFLFIQLYCTVAEATVILMTLVQYIYSVIERIGN